MPLLRIIFCQCQSCDSSSSPELSGLGGDGTSAIEPPEQLVSWCKRWRRFQTQVLVPFFGCAWLSSPLTSWIFWLTNLAHPSHPLRLVYPHASLHFLPLRQLRPCPPKMLSFSRFTVVGGCFPLCCWRRHCYTDESVSRQVLPLVASLLFTLLAYFIPFRHHCFRKQDILFVVLIQFACHFERRSQCPGILANVGTEETKVPFAQPKNSER